MCLFKSLYKCLMIVMALITSVSYVSINFLPQSIAIKWDFDSWLVALQDTKVPYFGQKIQQIDICRFKSEGEDSKKSSWGKHSRPERWRLMWRPSGGGAGNPRLGITGWSGAAAAAGRSSRNLDSRGYTRPQLPGAVMQEHRQRRSLF